MPVDQSFQRRMQGFGLLTAEIYYGMPDYPRFIQCFLWQEHDIAPHFPRLAKFIDYWRENIDGELRSVRVAHRALVTPTEVRFAQGVFRLQ